MGFKYMATVFLSILWTQGLHNNEARNIMFASCRQGPIYSTHAMMRTRGRASTVVEHRI